MKQPLAPAGEGFHVAGVRALLAILFAALLAQPAAAQIDSIDDLLRRLEDTPPRDTPQPNTPELPDPAPAPDLPPVPDAPGGEADTDAPPNSSGKADAQAGTDADAPDYSQLSRVEERSERLDVLFARLADAQNETQAGLVAEEIWALWTRSGSASVDFTLRRAATAQARGEARKARAFFDRVTQLEPGFAEGWARSGRLALDERDFSLAVGDSLRALRIEPRHYYALWTLGSVLERLGQPENALEVYREALALYPLLEGVEARVKTLEAQVNGGVL